MTTTALSPARICFAVPDVFAPVNVQTSSGPDGPEIVPTALVAASGISAMTGSPVASPVQLQKVRGSGVSEMNLERLVVAPSPGNSVGVPGRGIDQFMPWITSRVAPERHLAALGFEYWP